MTCAQAKNIIFSIKINIITFSLLSFLFSFSLQASNWSKPQKVGQNIKARQIHVLKNSQGRLELFFITKNFDLLYVHQTNSGKKIWSKATFLIKVESKTTPKENEMVYAKEMSDDYKKKQLKVIHDVAINMDIIISTALIPGKDAPLLIKSDTIMEMKSGSVLIDLAASSGGNIEGSKVGRKINIHNCVIYAPQNLPSLISYDSSLLFSKNVFNFITNFITENKTFDIESKDELLLKTILIKNGNKTENFFDG